MTDTPPERAEQRVDASRRAFLAASGVALAATTLYDPSARPARVTPAETLAPHLTAADLITPPAESYLAWHVDPATAPLLAHLARTATGLDATGTVAGGFVGRNGEQAPQFVETAAVPTAGDEAAASAERAVTDWFAATHGAAAERRRTGDSVEWRATADGWTDVVRLRHVGDWLLVASVGGRDGARVTPAAAAERYLAVLTARAEGAAP